MVVLNLEELPGFPPDYFDPMTSTSTMAAARSRSGRRIRPSHRSKEDQQPVGELAATFDSKSRRRPSLPQSGVVLVVAALGTRPRSRLRSR